MENIRLPRHVIDRLERRWSNRLQQNVIPRGDRGTPLGVRNARAGGSRQIRVIVKRARGIGGRLACD